MKIIAIDISLSEKNKKKCGVCVYDEEEKKITDVFSLFYVSIQNILQGDFFCFEKKTFQRKEVTVVFEDSNLLKANWHGHTARGGVGKNKAACIIFKQWLDLHEIKNKQIPPNGYSQFFRNKNDCKTLTGIEEKNADVRSAIAMIYKNHVVRV